MPTLFERIISGELPGEFRLSDDQVVAFRDIHPRAPTHILIVPDQADPHRQRHHRRRRGAARAHVTVAAELARREGIAEDGYRLIVNCNRTAARRSTTCTCTCSAASRSGPMVSV